MSAAVAVSAAVARSRRRIVARFKENGATSPDHAVAFHAVRPLDERIFRRLMASGVLKPAGEDRVYLDTDALQASDSRRHRFASAALLIVAVAALVALWLTYQ